MTKIKRYFLTVDLYNYEDDDEKAKKAAKGYIDKLQKTEDNQASIVSLKEQAWGTLTSTNIINPPIAIAPSGNSVVTTSFAWNTIIGTAPTTIVFDTPLGTSGSSWAITYTAVNSTMDVVFVKSITNRTASGFTVDAYEDNVTFEGTATLIT